MRGRGGKGIGGVGAVLGVGERGESGWEVAFGKVVGRGCE